MPSRRKKTTLKIDTRANKPAKTAKSVKSSRSTKPSKVSRKRGALSDAQGVSASMQDPKKQERAIQKQERSQIKQQRIKAKQDKKRAKQDAKLEKLKATKEKKSVQKRSRNKVNTDVSNVFAMPSANANANESGIANTQRLNNQSQEQTFTPSQRQEMLPLASADQTSNIRGARRDQQKQLLQDDKGLQDLIERANKEAFEEELQRSKRRAKSKRRARAQQRERRTHNAYITHVLRILGIVAAVLVTIFGAIFVYRSDLFHVDNIEVYGTYHLNNLEVTRIAAVSDDSTLLRLDEAGIKRRLGENAWVQNAEVQRVFPNTLKIIITERSGEAVVRINDKSIWVVSADGAWLSSATNDDWNAGPRIVDVSTSIVSPVSGKACDDEGILNALNAIKVLSQRTKNEIDTISAESAAKTTLNLKSGVSVAFGEAKDVELKEAAIWSILDKLQGKVSYINVHVPSRPTYRSITNLNDVDNTNDEQQ